MALKIITPTSALTIKMSNNFSIALCFFDFLTLAFGIMKQTRSLIIKEHKKYKIRQSIFFAVKCSAHMYMQKKRYLLHFVAFFHVVSLFSAGVDNKKVGVDNEKALELTNSTVFHRGRQ